MSGASHLNSHSRSVAGRTSGLKKSSRASAYGQSSGMTNFFSLPDWTASTNFSREPYSRINFRPVEGPILGMGSR
jgi:hypothetical protein